MLLQTRENRKGVESRTGKGGEQSKPGARCPLCLILSVPGIGDSPHTCPVLRQHPRASPSSPPLELGGGVTSPATPVNQRQCSREALRLEALAAMLSSAGGRVHLPTLGVWTERTHRQHRLHVVLQVSLAPYGKHAQQVFTVFCLSGVESFFGTEICFIKCVQVSCFLSKKSPWEEG